MNQRIEVTVYPVSDLARAKTLYRTLLGVDPYADQAYYVGFRVGDQEIGLDPYGHSCRLTHKSTKTGRYASGEENGEDMCQILIGSLGYILLLNIPESRHYTFTSHLRCKSQHETGRICLFILVVYSATEVASQARGVAAPFARRIVPERPM